MTRITAPYCLAVAEQLPRRLAVQPNAANKHAPIEQALCNKATTPSQKALQRGTRQLLRSNWTTTKLPSETDMLLVARAAEPVCCTTGRIVMSICMLLVAFNLSGATMKKDNMTCRKGGWVHTQACAGVVCTQAVQRHMGTRCVRHMTHGEFRNKLVTYMPESAEARNS